MEEIGEVRRTDGASGGLSIAVELTGLNDSNINELIRATNTALLKNKNENVSNSVTTIS